MILLLLKNEFNKKNIIISKLIKKIFLTNFNIPVINYFWLNIAFKNILNFSIVWFDYFYFVKKVHMEYLFNSTLTILVFANFFPLLFITKNKILKEFRINYFANLVKQPKKLLKMILLTSICEHFIESFIIVCFCFIYFVITKNFMLFMFTLSVLFTMISVFIIKMYFSIKAENLNKVMIFITTILKNMMALLFSYSFFSSILYLMNLTRKNYTSHSIGQISVDTARVNDLFTEYLLSKLNILISFFLEHLG